MYTCPVCKIEFHSDRIQVQWMEQSNSTPVCSHDCAYVPTTKDGNPFSNWLPRPKLYCNDYDVFCEWLLACKEIRIDYCERNQYWFADDNDNVVYMIYIRAARCWAIAVNGGNDKLRALSEIGLPFLVRTKLIGEEGG